MLLGLHGLREQSVVLLLWHRLPLIGKAGIFTSALRIEAVQEVKKRRLVTKRTGGGGRRDFPPLPCQCNKMSAAGCPKTRRLQRFCPGRRMSGPWQSAAGIASGCRSGVAPVVACAAATPSGAVEEGESAAPRDLVVLTHEVVDRERVRRVLGRPLLCRSDRGRYAPCNAALGKHHVFHISLRCRRLRQSSPIVIAEGLREPEVFRKSPADLLLVCIEPRTLREPAEKVSYSATPVARLALPFASDRASHSLGRPLGAGGVSRAASHTPPGMRSKIPGQNCARLLPRICAVRVVEVREGRNKRLQRLCAFHSRNGSCRSHERRRVRRSGGQGCFLALLPSLTADWLCHVEIRKGCYQGSIDFLKPDPGGLQY